MEGETTKYAADISSVKEAYDRIKSLVHRTPVLSSTSLDDISGRKLYFKCENFQKRGACNAVLSLTDEEASKGVTTHSSGNHAAALSLAAKIRGIPAFIVVPKSAPSCKVENIKRYDGNVNLAEDNMQSREEVMNKVRQETSAIYIPSSNDGRIMSGQGTISLEFLEQIPQIDTLVVPISGGGMIAGIAIAAKAINPAIRILAAEPKGADDAAQSKAAGRIIKLQEINTIADGLRAFLGDHTWPVVRDLVDDIITVEDFEIIKAMKLCFKILKIVIEPSGAIGLAAVLSETFQKNPAWKDCKHIGIVVSGGNVDMDVFWESLNK
ncbi:putative ammonia-lyase, Serine racemase [Medicago truncatula]|uniref:Serine racemase n=1 Tax=Medicago truncatula TaxID=3880 RepID=A0A396JT72_MEDTR|nr:putative ammonia-lyase, Serine racemase [Medicago truncatula]